MMKVVNSDKRLAKIKEERMQLLNMVKECLIKNKDEVDDEISEVIKVLDYDNKNIKKYNALVKAQKLIEELTILVIEVDSYEDIVNIRKKLNYYINKIKKELKDRGVSDDVYNSYYTKVTTLRGNITKYARFLRREGKLKEMEELNQRKNDLSDEEAVRLSKLLSNENRYNRDNLHPNPNKKKVTKQPVKVEPIIPEPVIITPQVPDNRPYKVEFNFDESMVVPGNYDADLYNMVSYDNDYDYFRTMIASYRHHYGVLEIDEYDNVPFLKNLVKFLKNISIYNKNKQTIKRMKVDAKMFYSGSDLIGYIEYLVRRNSIKNGLKSIFDKTYLGTNQGRMLNDHNRCVDWMLEFCRKYDLDISYMRRIKSM